MAPPFFLVKTGKAIEKHKAGRVRSRLSRHSFLYPTFKSYQRSELIGCMRHRRPGVPHDEVITHVKK